MVELSDDVVDLWIAPVQPARFEELLPRIARQLTASEIEAAQRLISERHRILYAVSHAFMRSVLARYLGREERSIEIVTGEHGRPELRDRSLRFNLSHTEGIAIVAMTRSNDIGVDVERIDHRRRVSGLARRVFTPAELQTWDGEPETFFSRWTLKEAYAKARGLGLSLGFHDFGFELSEPPVLQCDPELDDAGEWRFHSFEPLPRYRAAAAVRRRGPITWRRIAPQDVESLLPVGV